MAADAATVGPTVGTSDVGVSDDAVGVSGDVEDELVDAVVVVVVVDVGGAVVAVVVGAVVDVGAGVVVVSI